MKEDGWGLSYIYDQIVSKLDGVKDIDVYADLIAATSMSNPINKTWH